MRPNLLILGFLLLTLSVSAQFSRLNLNGKYFKENIFIMNPSIGDAFSIRKIIVNSDTLLDELNSNTIEVDFHQLGLKDEQSINLVILYDSLYPPFIQNPEALFPPEDVRFSKLRVKENTLIWRIGGVMSDYPIEVQQFKWNQWRTIGEVDPLDTIEYETYSLPVKMHSGENDFRLRTINFKEEEIFSRISSFKSSMVMPVKLISTKVTNEIEFSAETEYEIYGLDGIKLLSGFDRYVDVSSLPKGNYFVNFDNETVEIKKK